jgi:hypothetical protein
VDANVNTYSNLLQGIGKIILKKMWYSAPLPTKFKFKKNANDPS